MVPRIEGVRVVVVVVMRAMMLRRMRVVLGKSVAVRRVAMVMSIFVRVEMARR